MVIIKIIPNLLSQHNREVFSLPLDKDKTIKQYLDELKIDYSDHKILCSDRGRVEDINTTIKKDYPRNIDCEIIVTPSVNIPAIIAVVGYISAAYAVLKPFIVIGMLAYSIYSACTKPKTPSFNSGNSSGIDEDSPNSGWDGATTINQVGVAIPIIYGEYRVGGNIINRYISQDGDNNYLNMNLALCEGEIESVSDVYVAENPISNYDGIETAIRLGTNTQSVIQNFEDLHNLRAVGVTLLRGTGYEYTTIDQIEGFDIHFRCPNGLYSIDKQSGQVAAWTVTATVHYRLNGESTWILAGTQTISATSRSTVRRIFSHRGLTLGTYDIKVTRTSADSSLDPVLAGDLTFYQIDEIQTDDLTYPNLAQFAIKALATEQLQGNEPNVTMLVKGTKVRAPKVLHNGVEVPWDEYYYDPVAEAFKRLIDDLVCTWDGTTYVTRWSANPVWCLRDLLTNARYGLGEFIAEADMDDDKLLEMALYCEERVSDGEGGYEKRYRLDMAIDSTTRAMDAILQLCTAFDAFPVYSGGKLSFKIDKAETSVQLFTMGNIVKDSFNMSWRSDNDAPNVIHAQYNDVDKEGRTNIVSYFDDAVVAQYPAREQTIRIFTSRKSYALRAARRALAVAKYIDRGIAFKASIDAIACQAGDRISVAHDVPQWSAGSGRVQTGSSTTNVKLDRIVQLAAATTYKLQVRFADGTIEEKTVTNATGAHSELTVSVAFSQTPAAFDVYAVGVENIVTKDFRVTSLSKSDKFEMTITAMEYNASIFDESAITIPDTNFSSLDTTLKDVENLILSEGLIKQNDGTWANSIEVWFNKPTFLINSGLNLYDHAEIWLSDDSQASWRKVGETWGENFSVTDPMLKIGWTYQVSVRAIGKFSSRPLSASPQGTITLTGGNTVPPDVVNLQIFGQGIDTTFQGKDVKFKWAGRSNYGSGNVPVGEDAGLGTLDVSFKDFQVEIIVAGIVKRTEFVTDTWYEYTFDKNSADNNNAPVTTFTVRVYQRNHYNKLSAYPAELTVTNIAPKRISGVSWDFSGKDMVISWSPQPACDVDFRRYKIIVTGSGAAKTYYRDSTSFFYGYDENVAHNGGGGSRNLTVDIYAEDWFGQLSNVYTIAAVNAVPPVPLLTLTPFFNMAMLKWTDAGDTDLKYYEIWQSANNLWAGEETLADKVTGRMSLVKVDADDQTLFFKVRGVDTFGPGSFTGPHQAVFIAVDAADVTKTGALITALAQIDNAVIEQLTVGNIDAGSIVSGYLSADRIEAGSIQAEKLDVDQLSAIAADLGIVTAGTITGATVRTAISGARSIMDIGGMRAYDADNAKILDVIASGDDAGDILLGDYAGGKGIKYDKSAGALHVGGDITATSGLFTGTVSIGTAGKVYIDGANEIIKVYDASNNLRVELGKLS